MCSETRLFLQSESAAVGSHEAFHDNKRRYLSVDEPYI